MRTSQDVRMGVICLNKQFYILAFLIFLNQTDKISKCSIS